MLSNVLDRISFYSFFLVVVLLPVFLIPGSQISVGASKGLILVVGLVVSLICFLVARIKEGKISIPKSGLLVSGGFVVLATLVSAIFSSSQGMSFFGVLFDTGSFWFILAAFVLLFMASLIVREGKSSRLLLLGVLLSLTVVFVFQILRFISPDLFSLGIFSGATGNLVGSWNNFGLLAGFAVVFCVSIIEFFQVSKFLKWLLGVLILLSLFLMATVSFSIIWKLVGIFALLVFVYKISTPSKEDDNGMKGFPILSFVLILVSLLFLVSRGFIGDVLPNALSVQTVEVRPSFSGTVSVAQGVFDQNPVFGFGPNRWSDAWSMYKPTEVNDGPFWDVAFNTGSGFIPTAATVGGALTLLGWLLFLIFTISADMKLLSSLRREITLESVAFFVGAIYFFVAAFFYSAGVVIILLLFAFLGVFIGLSRKKDEDFIHINFKDNPKKSFVVTLLLVVIMLASAGIGFKYIEKFTSTFYWSKTFSSSNVEEAEKNILRAISLNPNDLYYRTYIQVYFTKLNSFINQDTPITEEQRTELQTGFNSALVAASQAIRWNPENYLNFQSLGLLYSTAASTGDTQIYNQALDAYTRASELNPVNPRLKLEIARTNFTLGQTEEARNLLNQALELKDDYVDGWIAFSQIEVQAGNIGEAISYAERALAIVPDNQNISNYLQSLRSGDLNVSPVEEEEIPEENIIELETEEGDGNPDNSSSSDSQDESSSPAEEETDTES